MKKLFLLALCTVFAVNTFAQDGEAPAKKPSNKGFVTNGFWDNWEVSLGVGTTYENISNKLGEPDYGEALKCLGLEVNAAFTKWFHPIWGVRGQLQGGFSRGYATPAAKARLVTNFLYAHADAMMNFSNWVGGYREDRVYYAVPFLGFGYQLQDVFDGSKPNNGEFAATIGLLNKFRVCNCVDINLELKAWAYAERDHVLSRGGKGIISYSATVGASYRFGKRNFERKVAGSDADAAAYAALLAEKDAALAAAAAEAEALREAANKKPVEVLVEKQVEVYVGGKAVVFFGLGSTKLTDHEKITLDLKADQIKNGPAMKVYHIEGHADSKTGSASYNLKVSEARAKAVYDYLVEKGVKPEQLTYKGVGDKEEPFTTAETNRVAIIE